MMRGAGSLRRRLERVAAVAADHRLAGRPALEARAAVGAVAGEKVRSLTHRGVRPEAAHHDITRGAPGSAGVAVRGACIGGAIRARVGPAASRRRPARTARISPRFGLPGMAPPPPHEARGAVVVAHARLKLGQRTAAGARQRHGEARRVEGGCVEGGASNDASTKAEASNPAGNSMAPQHTSPPPHEAVFTHPMWNGVLHALVVRARAAQPGEAARLALWTERQGEGVAADAAAVDPALDRPRVGSDAAIGSRRIRRRRAASGHHGRGHAEAYPRGKYKLCPVHHASGLRRQPKDTANHGPGVPISRRDLPAHTRLFLPVPDFGQMLFFRRAREFLAWRPSKDEGHSCHPFPWRTRT